MKLRLVRLSGECDRDGVCATIYLTEHGTAIIQGYVITDPETLAALNLPEGEAAVEIPLDVLQNAVSR